MACLVPAGTSPPRMASVICCCFASLGGSHDCCWYTCSGSVWELMPSKQREGGARTGALLSGISPIRLNFAASPLALRHYSTPPCHRTFWRLIWPVRMSMS